jgi:FkbM family methyltransferase
MKTVFKKDWSGFLSWLLWQAVRVIKTRRNVSSRGLNFTLQCDNWITFYRWRSFSTKEPEMLDYIDTQMRGGDILFDIGANIGIYTIYAARRHLQAHVVAFEPEYANLHLLRDNIVENALQGRVDVYPIALSNRSGISQLHIQDFTPGAALHTESRDAIGVTRTQHPVVWSEGTCTFTVDAFCDESGLQPNCLKIDVDGTEQKVLEGAVRTLSSPRLHSIIIELPDEGHARDVCERLMCAAGLRREWWERSAKRNNNEIWVRDVT